MLQRVGHDWATNTTATLLHDEHMIINQNSTLCTLEEDTDDKHIPTYSYVTSYSNKAYEEKG